MHYQEVFTPNDFPTVTYVDRAEHKLEARLRDVYETPNMVISVAGPSKSGKTVLIKKVVPEDMLITVRGASIKGPDDLWVRVLDWMGAPVEISEQQSTSNEVTGGSEGGGGFTIPFAGKIEAKLTAGGTRGWGGAENKTFLRTGLEQVIREIGKSDFVVFIDDFHYIPAAIRDDIGKQIKAAAESGVKIFTASVPHRSDDVVRSNPELRGRVVAIDLELWTSSELIQIARKGFEALNVDLAPDIERRFAAEAFGSPQLMQSICLNLALVLDVRETLPELVRIEVSPESPFENGLNG